MRRPDRDRRFLESRWVARLDCCQWSNSSRFLASDPIRVFYVNIETESGTQLEQTLDLALAVEQVVRSNLQTDEARGIVTYAGQQFTERSRRGEVIGVRYWLA